MDDAVSELTVERSGSFPGGAGRNGKGVVIEHLVITLFPCLASRGRGFQQVTGFGYKSALHQ